MRPSLMSGSGPEALPGVVEISARKSRSGREAIPDVRKLSGGPYGCPAVVGRHSQMSGSGGRHSWVTVSGLETLLDVHEWSGDPPGCPGVVERPSRMSGSGREAHSDVR